MEEVDVLGIFKAWPYSALNGPIFAEEVEKDLLGDELSNCIGVREEVEEGNEARLTLRLGSLLLVLLVLAGGAVVGAAVTPRFVTHSCPSNPNSTRPLRYSKRARWNHKAPFMGRCYIAHPFILHTASHWADGIEIQATLTSRQGQSVGFVIWKGVSSHEHSPPNKLAAKDESNGTQIKRPMTRMETPIDL